MSTTLISRPEATEYAPSYGGYISQVPGGDLLAILEDQRRDTQQLLAALPETRALHRYAPGKWSVKEVVGHVSDTERVFSYRALRFARGDAQPLAGFDEQAWVPAAGFDRRSLPDLLADLDAVRRATIALFRGFDAAALARKGTANNREITVRALAYVIAGHERHHLGILRERYRV
jgi:hypothetical protein